MMKPSVFDGRYWPYLLSSAPASVRNFSCAASLSSYFCIAGGMAVPAALSASICVLRSVRLPVTSLTFSNWMCERRRFCSTKLLASRRRLPSTGSVPLSVAVL